ncbi:hypothetical protein B0O99DRAFT_671078 [Bisporella sp. PMI_857]|nr:hypothetical protein B0O99DRAFT_671078 [Bisporella sp. PMI_857]
MEGEITFIRVSCGRTGLGFSNKTFTCYLRYERGLARKSTIRDCPGKRGLLVVESRIRDSTDKVVPAAGSVWADVGAGKGSDGHKEGGNNREGAGEIGIDEWSIDHESAGEDESGWRITMGSAFLSIFSLQPSDGTVTLMEMQFVFVLLRYCMDDSSVDNCAL